MTLADTASERLVLADSLRAARLDSVLHGVALSIISSCLVAASAAAILWLDQPDMKIWWWLGLLVGFNLLRLAGARYLHHLYRKSGKTEMVMRLLVAGAFLGGVCWALVPIYLVDITQGGHSSYVVFILAGIAAGATIQSPAKSLNAIAFFMPPQLVMIYMMLTAGGPMQIILGLNIVLLTIMLTRSSMQAERAFIESQTAALQASSLARSLSGANSAIRESNERLVILANQDSLTGLANRALFNRKLEWLIGNNAQKDTKVALLVLDIDLFKSINDTLGHSAGDAVLQRFAERLGTITAKSDIVARLGGDEFAVIMHGPDAEARALDAAEALLDLNMAPMLIGDIRPLVGCSIGIALCPEHERDANGLFTCADMALYEAKASGRRCYHVFNSALKERIERRLRIETQLGEALADGVVEAFFQPQIALASGAVAGFEALVRWDHPTMGPIRPDEIVAAAKVMHLSDKLTGLMARAACGLIKSLDASERDDIVVAVNVSPSEFNAYSPAAVLEAIAREQGVAPERLEIEITEEALLDTDAAQADLEALEAAGFGLAVDDFGMGHSSLAYLLRLKITRLKIDRRFVDGIAKSAANRALVTALVSVGRSLSIDIVAEGVETPEDADILRRLGCRYAQGYFYGRPMPLVAAMDWMASWDDAAQARKA